MPIFRRKKKDDVVDPDERSPELGVRFKDLQVMASLIASGADLTQPRHVLYYCYFTDKETSERAATMAREAGFTAEVREPLPEYPGQWAMVSELSDAVVSPDFVIASDNLFQDVADRLGGEFDGWEASV